MPDAGEGSLDGKTVVVGGHRGHGVLGKEQVIAAFPGVAGGGFDAEVGGDSDDPARLIKAQPRVTRLELGRITVAKINQEIRFPATIRKELGVNFRIVETGHGPGVQAKRPGGEDEISALKRCVAERVRFGEFLFPRRCKALSEIRIVRK